MTSAVLNVLQFTLEGKTSSPDISKEKGQVLVCTLENHKP